MKTQETTTAAATKQSTKKSKASKSKATKATNATRAAKSPKQAADSEARAGSKKEIVLKLLRRDQGATITDIAKATDWQNHSIRGFLSAQVSKKMGLKLESTKSNSGERTYRVVA